MKLRGKRTAVAVASALIASLSVVGVAPAANSADPSSITVWMMGDYESWPGAVTMANKEFNKKYPNTTVVIEKQTWADHLTKFEATLASNNVPDVIEFGNTEVTKYAAAGALADLTSYKAGMDNSKTWLKGLTDAGSYNGKLYAVPYYAGSRAVIYRTDMYKAVGAKIPTSYAEFLATSKKVQAKYGASNKNFSAIHMPGKYWYAAMSFVYDAKGSIAKKNSAGKWVGNLSSPESIAGLNRQLWCRCFLQQRLGTRSGIWRKRKAC
jgi:N,N'-diacetylchitobiose transport system substrate-binding protein